VNVPDWPGPTVSVPGETLGVTAGSECAAEAVAVSV
jgi:hypothetical protein